VKRGVFDVLRRGFDNTVANWPLILIRLAAQLLYVALAVGGAIAILVPTLISVGIRLENMVSPDDVMSALELLLQQWMIFVWIFVGITVLLLVIVLIQSFVTAGHARVAVDADRLAGPLTEGPRSRYRAFSMERWLAGATDGWWTLFWIYNLAWGAGGLILLIPLLPTLVLMLLFRNEEGLALATGCLGLAVSLLVLFVVGIVTNIWTTRAIASWALRRSTARGALAAAWREFRGDFLRHAGVAICIVVVGMAGSTFFAGFSMLGAFGDIVSREGGGAGFGGFFMFPVRIIASLASTAFSAAVAGWYLAAYAALAVERGE
jgi:hypothetical protein